MIAGQGEVGVDDAAEHVVDEPAEVPGDEPEGRSEDGRQDRRGRRHDEDVARAEHDPREHVAPDAVGAEAGARSSAAPRSFSGSVANGSSGVIVSPRIAHTTQIPMIAMPTMKTFERRSSASCSRRALLSASEGGAVAAGASAPIEVPAAVIPGPPVGRAG